MDDSDVIKLVERLVLLEARVAELEKRHGTREVIGQVRGLEQHALRRVEALEARAEALETQVSGVARSGLLGPSFWTRVLTVAGYMAVVALLGLLALLILWGLFIMAALFLTPAGLTHL
jgi:hypothetical protein